jgi:hypothetical protein
MRFGAPCLSRPARTREPILAGRARVLMQAMLFAWDHWP